MRITIKIALAAVLMTLSVRYSFSGPGPEGKAKMDSMTVTQLENAGDLARAQKDYDQAIEYFRAALRKDGRNSQLYNKLGISEMKNNDLNSAAQDFKKAVKYNSKSADAVSNLGAVYYQKKSYGSAAKYFKKAVALDETRPVFHINLGAAWFAQKKLEGAVAEYTRALQLDPYALEENARTGVVAQIASTEERARFSYMLAKIYASRGDIESCLQCLKKAKDEGYRNLASVYKDEEFARMREDPRLHDIVPPPQPK
ncbi:MAG TPA: tetratricopeptide repeat protein [Terriglobales bacterium]|nr:tetratricopeptide repeat protein [Terriglobales bacterium]